VITKEGSLCGRKHSVNKNPNDNIGRRTHHLLSFRTMSQPSAPPRTPELYCTIFAFITTGSFGWWKAESNQQAIFEQHTLTPQK